MYHIVIHMIGEFEYLVLATAARLGEDAYGLAIQREIKSTVDRACSIGALYTTLSRLEDKGLITTWMGQPTPERGGRPKRLVRVTSKGRAAAAKFFSTVKRASHGLAWSVE